MNKSSITNNKNIITNDKGWHCNIFTIFPQAFPGTLGLSLIGQAMEHNLWSYQAINIRDFATDKHSSVDDEPYGGGAGMVLKADVVGRSVESIYKSPKAALKRLFYLSPRGSVFNQQKAQDMAKMDNIGLICGRFEGIDQRFLDHWGVEELSIGDFVLAGGEVAAQLVIESIVRTLPGVLGSSKSLNEESFSDGLLEYPQYTRPQKWEGKGVPEVLISGHHGKVAKWRHEQSEQLTKTKRPDLWQKYVENT